MRTLTLVNLVAVLVVGCGPLPEAETVGGSSSSPNAGNTAGSGTTGNGGNGAGSTATGGTTTGPGGGSNSIWPVVPDHGGHIIAKPQLVLITFDGDPDRSALEPDAAWLMTGGYLDTVGAEYGVGSGSVLANVHMSDTPPTPDQVVTYLAAHLDDGTLPAYDPSNIYALAIPFDAASSAAFCAADLGYHSYFATPAGQAAYYAVILDCGGDLTQTEVTLSHEVVETATDPMLTTYQIQDASNPWAFLGGEVGDLCASNTTYVWDPTNTYAAQLIWSNKAAAAGGVPCQPWAGTTPYVSPLSNPGTTQMATAGTTQTFTLVGWASATTSGAWSLIAEDGIGNFKVNPVLSTNTLSAGGQTTVTVQIPSGAAPGQHGAVWIGVSDPSTNQIVGSTVIAVGVQ